MDTQHLIEHLLDTERERHALTSDEALARHLSAKFGITVSDQAIYRWRKGQVHKATQFLLHLALEQHEPKCAA